MSANGSSVTKLDNIDDVDECLTESNELSLMGATVIAVKKFEKFNACTYCKGKVKVVENNIVECSKCGATLLLSRCPFNQMAKLDLEGPDTTFVTVVVYNDLIKAIVEQDQQTTTSLLKAKPFDITYNQYHVATSVSATLTPGSSYNY